MLSVIFSRRRLIRKIVLIVLGLGACAGIFYIGFTLLFIYSLSSMGDMFDSPICEPTNSSGIESVAQIQLPPSMSNLRSMCGGMQGIWATAYFDMKPSDLNVFVNSTKVKLPLSTTGRLGQMKCGLCNDMTNLRSYLYGTYSAEEWFEEIFIDTSNPAQYRVYFTLLAG
jgi:hypothetical protein